MSQEIEQEMREDDQLTPVRQNPLENERNNNQKVYDELKITELHDSEN